MLPDQPGPGRPPSRAGMTDMRRSPDWSMARLPNLGPLGSRHAELRESYSCKDGEKEGGAWK